MKEVRDSVHEMKRDEFQKVTSWLSVLDPVVNHDRARKKHEPGTEEWLLKSDIFQHWTTRRGSSVWLHGIPGAGKTILCSTIVELVKRLCKGSAAEYAYFYFDFNDSQKRVPVNMLRSILAQLCVHRNVILPAVQKLYSSHEKGAVTPSMDSLLRVLPSAIGGSQQVFMVLDALDECENREDLFKILAEFLRIPEVNLLLTSRKERDITDVLQTSVELQIHIESQLVDADVEVHVQRCLETDNRLKKWPNSVKEEMNEALIKGAHGRLVYVLC